MPKTLQKLFERHKKLILPAFLLTGFTQLFPNDCHAETVLGATLTDAASHDFIDYFGFKDNKLELGKDGLFHHYLYSTSWTSFLVLGLDSHARIVHMKLGVPRPLIDDEAVTTRGRDIVKSFLLAAELPEDKSNLERLADEIYVRGLDLQAIKLDEKTIERMGANAKGMQAFKVGRGPLSNGDNAIFLKQIPQLDPKPSIVFETVIGRIPHTTLALKRCNISIVNTELRSGKSPIKIMWCEIWDGQYFQAHKPHQTGSK